MKLTASQDRMLKAIDTHAGVDGWATWEAVYNEWDPQNVPPQFAGQAAQKVWNALESRGLVEDDAAGRVRRKAAPISLTEREQELLNEMPAGIWVRPMDVGGHDGSHHGQTLRAMARKGAIQQKTYSSLAGIRASYMYLKPKAAEQDGQA